VDQEGRSLGVAAAATALVVHRRTILQRGRDHHLRILILMSDTGGGHRSAAQAIEQGLQRRAGEAVQVSVVDYLALSGFPLSWARPGYSVIIHHPWLWRIIFRATDRSILPALLHGPAGGLVRRAVRLAVQQVRPDIVVSVHPLATAPASDALDEMSRAGARRLAEPLPLVVVVTDMVTIHPAWAAPRAEAVVAATEKAKKTLVQFGVPEERISVLGLPVDARCAETTASRQDLRRQLGWDEGRFAVLLVGGGEGAGGLEEQVAAIAETTQGLQLAVVAGRNEHLCERLRGRDWGLTLHSYGFVQNMPDLMRAADLLVTKAGPGTISEALVCGLPMVITSALPGQEEGNVGYVVDHGAGLLGTTSTELAQIVKRLSGDSGAGELSALAQAANRLAKPNAADDIARLILATANRGAACA
jgi:1,2-diacylglycerol 3-beta-galactosyltransferase